MHKVVFLLLLHSSPVPVKTMCILRTQFSLFTHWLKLLHGTSIFKCEAKLNEYAELKIQLS
jgi:hypothetical protein